MTRSTMFRRAVQGVVEQLECRRMLSGEPLDFGDAPNTYGTTLAVNGARHFSTPNLLMGANVDAEPDGLPSIDALRDDLTGVPDDEDGVTFVTPIAPGAVAQVSVLNNTATGVLNAWLDFNANLTFDAGEQIIVNQALPGGGVSTVYAFAVPAAATIGLTYARFRLAQTAGAGPIGLFGFGEVEDYRIAIQTPEERLEFGDAPDTAAGPFFYPTIFGGSSGDPARHRIAPNGPRLGPTIDYEFDGQPNLTASGDDINFIYPGVADDEDGVTMGGGIPIELVPLMLSSVAPIEVNNTGVPGLLSAWFDWNQNGSWEATEQVATDLPIPVGLTIVNVPVPNTMLPSSFVDSRFRLSTLAGLSPKGLAPDGEVEDYRQLVEGTLQNLDFGDAPDAIGTPFSYPTMIGGLSGNPARHAIVANGPRLGPTIDAEPDGQQTILANGDDLGGIDDENGVTVGGVAFETVPLVSGSVMTIQVTNGAAAPGRLNAWFDWNQNGSWSAAELVLANAPLPGGVSNFSFFVPGGLTANSVIYSRFRVNTLGGLGTGGPAADGEVEDYRNRALPDTIPPTVVSGALEYETRQAISLTFSEPLNPLTVSAADLSAFNLDDGTTPVATSVILSAGNTVATWVFNTPGTFINDGDYSFTLAAGSVSDVAGNGLGAAFNLSGPTIFYFAGDADRNRIVNLLDFNILAANFGLVGRPFSMGNFDYDAAGLVGLNDFNLLAARFGLTVAPSAGPGPGGGLLFSQTQIDPKSLELLELLE